jgi:hypothetical protein
MTNDEAPRSVQGHISIQQIGAETLVYDERRHKAFCLNESSSVIWRLADGEHTVAEMSAAASLELKTEVSDEFVLFALDQLRRDGLIERFSNDEAVSTISRRVMLQRLGIKAALLLPVIAAVVAPAAAQTYNGCVDCPSSSPARGRRRRVAGVSPD